jgi:uncharacterized protein (TIGR02145 family)
MNNKNKISMKKLFVFLIIAPLLFISCKKDEEKEKEPEQPWFLSRCNSNTPEWGSSGLGTVSFASNQTWTAANLVWSDAVQATRCNKTSFDGGDSKMQTTYNFNADCRSNPGRKGDLFSWCAVARFREELCPAPWRVPTSNDHWELVKSYGRTFHTPTIDVNLRNRLLNSWGGTYSGYCNATGSLQEQGQWGLYWSLSPVTNASSSTLQFATDGYVVEAQDVWMSYGLTLRCVRDR